MSEHPRNHDSGDIFILHVEDNPDDVELTRLAFLETGFPYKVVVADDGAEALDFLFARGAYAQRDRRHAPALVLLDLNLPKVHGLDVLRKLKGDPILKHVLVVILSSSNEEKDRKRAAELGTNLYVQKPVNFDDFAAVARKIEKLLGALTKP